jgi:hypothetical protein
VVGFEEHFELNAVGALGRWGLLSAASVPVHQVAGVVGTDCCVPSSSFGVTSGSHYRPQAAKWAHLSAPIQVDGETWRRLSFTIPPVCVGCVWHGRFGGCRALPLPSAALTSRWSRMLAAAAVRPVRLHDARHTCGTLMHLEGVPIAVIAAWLGHALSAFTMAAYVHSRDPALADAARSLARVVTNS